MDNTTSLRPDPQFLSNALGSFVQIGALFLLLVACYRIVAPFTDIVTWAVIIAVAIYPSYVSLAGRLGGSNKMAAIAIVLAGIAIVIAPMWLLAESTLTSLQTLAGQLHSGAIDINPPAESVADWPLIGGKVFEIWTEAAANVEATINQFEPQLRALGAKVVSFAGGMAITGLQFVLSIIIAGALLTVAEGGHSVSLQIGAALVGKEKGSAFVDLATKTTRSVFKGVLGVAFIQAFFAAIGLVAMSVPAAGLLAGGVLVLAIIQLPPWLLLGPVIVYVYSYADPIPATIFAVYSIIVSLADAFLKPMLLGRGVDVPMLVILLGAIGGAFTAGIIGLFIGAVVLALGYEILVAWMRESDADPSAADETAPA